MTKMDAARNRRAAKYGLASLTLASAMTFASFYREPSPFVRCEELVKEVVNFPSKTHEKHREFAGAYEPNLGREPLLAPNAEEEL